MSAAAICDFKIAKVDQFPREEQPHPTSSLNLFISSLQLVDLFLATGFAAKNFYACAPAYLIPVSCAWGVIEVMLMLPLVSQLETRLQTFND